MVRLQGLEHSDVSEGINAGVAVRRMYVVQQSGQDDTAVISPTVSVNVNTIFIS